ncbi:MAG TPA: carboxypeptidase-like regulatory domain-containing protein [Thermoanaerobaculia bacterium]
MIRRLSLLFLSMLLLVPAAAIAQTSAPPDLPWFKRTITIPAGQTQTVQDTLVKSACDPVGTRYRVVIRNGNPDGTGMVATGVAEIDGYDYDADAMADGTQLIDQEAFNFTAMNTTRIGGTAPASHDAVVTMEIWRKPISATLHSQTYTFPQSATTKQFTASFTGINLENATLVLTRKGGLQAADQFKFALNGTAYVKTKADFTLTQQTRVYFVNLKATNSIVIDATAASESSEVTVQVFRHAADTVAPALSLTGTIPTVVTSSSYTFNGTVTDARGIASLTLNGDVVTVGANGAFSKAVTLTHGAPNTFTFLAYDCTGKGTKVVKTMTWDRDAPVVAIRQPAPNAFTKTQFAVDGTTTDDGGGQPAVTVNGQLAEYEDATNWRAVINITPTPEGPRSVTVIATDAKGRATTIAIPVILDATKPAITATFDPPATPEGWSPVGATVTFTCNDANGIQLCMPFQPHEVQEGRYSVQAMATDKAGNLTTLNQQIKGDGFGPAINLTAVPHTNQTSLVINEGIFEDQSGLASVTCNGQPATFTADQYTCTVALTAGPNTVVVVATDKVGNQETEQFEIRLDQQAPVLTLVAPVDGAQAGSSITISGTATDDYDVFHIKANGTVIGTGNGEFSGSIPLSPGSNTITVVVNDYAGNTVTKTVTVMADATPPTITATLTPPPVNGWNGSGATVTFTCTDADSGIAICPEPVTLTESGFHPITGSATDNAGNSANTSIVVRVDADAPQLTINSVPAATKQSPLTITGTASDAHSGLASVDCEGVAATIDGSSFTCTVSLEAGSNFFVITAADNAGNRAVETAIVVLDAQPPVITVAQPADGSTVNTATVHITGTVTDDDQLTTVRVGGVSVTPVNGQFERTISLTQGANTILIEATDRAGNSGSTVVHVTRYIVPTISITSPRDLIVLRDTTTTVTGVVSDPTSTVDVNGVAASVSGSGSYTATGVALQQGRTVITANATSPSGGTATTSINVYRDSIPPRLQVYSPEDGATVYSSPISISGMVDDIVVGTINSQQMRVTVNGQQATVSNRAWLRSNVALAAGPNTLLITATDEGGNSTTVSYTVTLVVAPPKPRLEIVSGNSQTATIGTLLPAPLVVRALNSDGSPVTNAPLTFSIIDNDGLLTSGDTTARAVNVTTDAQGQASVRWTVGNRAGAGNNRLSVSGGATFAAPLEASAAGTMAPPALLVVDTGNNQYGIAADALPRPLVAIAVDAGNNRLANIPVTFTVSKGGGSFNGQSSITVQTDSDGRAVVRPTLGPDAGDDNNTFTATTTGVTQTATFNASGRFAKPAAATSVTGVVLDNTTVPLTGVTVRIDGTSLTTQTNAQGQFTLTNVPVGYVKLFIDGSTAQRPGTWPTLEFALYTLPGVANDVGMPIYLVEIDNTHSLFVDDTTGGTLTLPELPGFALKVAPGSATFPGGGRTGHVSVTLVHADRMPMAPGFGQQPKFIVTIQPAGTHFDPPAQLTLPNTDGLKPGEVTEMYSFDHDLGQFVAIGTASVSKDGATITSDPGVGIIKGGWHCGGNPSAGGTGAHCNDCLKCENNICVPDTAMNDQLCGDFACHKCVNGACNGYSDPAVPLDMSKARKVQVPAPAGFLPATWYGRCAPVDMKAVVEARCDNGNWKAVVTDLQGQYSIVWRLFSGQAEITTGSTTATNYCDQARQLADLGMSAPHTWYVLSAVEAHEKVHETRLEPALQAVLPQIKTLFDAITLPILKGETDAQGTARIRALPQTQTALTQAFALWEAEYNRRILNDHTTGGPTDSAESAITAPLRTQICTTAVTNTWPACAPAPPTTCP